MRQLKQWQIAKQEQAQRVKRVVALLNRAPDAVIDVGVNAGTPWLYAAFPDVPFVLIDPQRGGERLLTSRPERYVYVQAAAGSKAGRMTLHETGAMSSLKERTKLTWREEKAQYDVDIVALDDVIERHLPEAKNIALKIDTEGFELEVLAGLNRNLDKIDVVISEASVLNRFENSYNFSELIGAFWERGLRFYNILDLVEHPAPRVYDCIFLKKDDKAFDG